MKNIYVLTTDKPSRLHKYNFEGFALSKEALNWKEAYNIYITSDEEIKEGDYFIAYSVTSDKKPFISCASEYKECKKDKGKIILTTDQDLIKDGVQAIDDEFLEWFVKNPSCKCVEVKSWIKTYEDGSSFDRIDYEIIIPKEEPKQEILEDIAERLYKKGCNISEKTALIYKRIFIEGAKWQQEQDKRMYSEEDMKSSFQVGFNVGYNDEESPSYLTFEEWIKEYKKK